MSAPPHATIPGPQYAQQFLSAALSQRGPAALPYAEDAKWLIRHHLLALAETYPSLHPKVSAFTHNDGRTDHLLHADGTIPILYQGSPYNIPASVWLLEPYPRLPPAVFLSPTANMLVKPNHPLVDRSAAVSVPYLRSWLYPSSNLVDLVGSLSRLFSLDPPLYTRPNSAPIASNPNPPSSSRPFSSSSTYGGRLPQSPQQARPAEDPAEVYCRNATAKIVDALHADAAGLRKSREAEMEDLFTTQAALRQRAGELASGLRQMNDEREGLEQRLQLVVMNVDVLGGWVRENEGRMHRRKGDVDIDDAFEPAGALGRQMTECTAADLAIEDMIYALDKAVQEGVIMFDMYMKNVRGLAREQFFHRALTAKIRAAQVQAQVTSMSARTPLYSS